MQNLSIALGLTLLGFTATSNATTWYVPGDAASIQAGLDLASPGDTVLVAGDT